MGLYSLVLLAAIAFLTYVGSAPNVTAANSPTQAGRSVKKQTGTSTERFLRADEAVGEGNEARMMNLRIGNGLTKKLRRMSSKILKNLGIGNDARNTIADEALTAPLLGDYHALADETLTLPLLGDHHIIADETLRAPVLKNHHPTSLERLNKAPEKLLNEEELARVLNLVKEQKLVALDAQLTKWQRGGKSADDVFDLLKMKEDGYAKFDMNKFVVLEKYVAKVMDNHRETLLKFLISICEENIVTYTLLMRKLAALRQDSWFAERLNLLLERWRNDPKRLDTYLKSEYAEDNQDVKFIRDQLSPYLQNKKV